MMTHRGAGSDSDSKSLRDRPVHQDSAACHLDSDKASHYFVTESCPWNTSLSDNVNSPGAMITPVLGKNVP